MKRAIHGCLLVLVASVCPLALGCAEHADAALDGESSSPLDAVGRADGPAAVVLVVVDTLRADICSVNGHYRKTTPFIDSLAENGVVFTAAYAPSSWTVPSMASLHTSLYPVSHGIFSGAILSGAGEKYQQQVLGDSFVTLAEVLKGAGYKTIGVPANMHLGAKLGFGQGFDAYFDDARFLNAKAFNRVAEGYLDQALGPGWPATFGEKKAFVWLHYFDPHAPYVPRLPWIRAFAPDYLEHPADFPAKLEPFELHARFPRADRNYRECALPLYEAEVAYWDDRFKRLARKLGVEQRDVLVVFTSDHGEEFADHGQLGHTHTLYEELVRVPLVFYWPRGIRSGARIDEPVSILDIYPTLLELAGVDPPAGLQGRSLAPLLRGERSPDPERELLFELYPPKPTIKAIRQGRWKLIQRFAPHGEAMLFDLVDDPGERHDLAAARPKVTARLVERLAETIRELPPAPTARRLDVIDAELREQLERLGYLAEDYDDGLLQAREAGK
jgi:arylsulfatase A-like enzyme